jgi:hypothetical protein
MIYEIQMSDRFFYAKGSDADAAAAKVKKAFGGHFSHAFATGRTKTRGTVDC